MRIVTLSDFAAEQLQRARAARQEAYRKELEHWQAKMSEQHAQRELAEQAVRDAWRARKPSAILLGLWRWIGARLKTKPSVPQPMAPLDIEGRLTAGSEGETQVLEMLTLHFDDRWLAIRGYCNGSGETDVLIVGPTGAMAIEVKYLNALVRVRGSSWTRDKVDRFGNVVERDRPVTDAAGRSPAAQVNAVADALQAQLGRRGVHLRVKRAVVLAHPASRLAEVRDPGVDLVAVASGRGFADSMLALAAGGSGSSSLDVATLERLIREDHAYHLRMRARRGDTAGSGVQASSSAGLAPRLSEESAIGSKLKSPRPVRHPEPSEDGLRTASQLELRQADALMGDVQRLLLAQEDDGHLESKVRRTVAGHLASGGRTRVVSVALTRSKEERAKDLLRSIVHRCRYTLDLPDRTLTAIVVPVAVRWTIPPGADWSTVEVASASRPHLNTPALDIRAQTEALRVRFAAAFYEYGTLASIDASTIRNALLQIEEKQEPDPAQMRSVVLRPTASSSWRLVYLLGVIVTEPDEPVRLDDTETQRALTGKLDMVADAVVWPAELATGDAHAAETAAEGVWTLDEGLAVGRRLQHEHLLQQVLASRRNEARPLQCWYAYDAPRRSTMFLMRRHSGSWDELTFGMLSESDPLRAFREVLDAAIACQLPAGTDVQINEVDLYQYRKLAKQAGRSWISRSKVATDMPKVRGDGDGVEGQK